MQWYSYVACFFAGAFVANVPHLVHGISGNRFPTPFAKPPGRGLSSPTVNVVWAIVNLIVGYLAFQAGHVGVNFASPILFLARIRAISLLLSVRLQANMRE